MKNSASGPMHIVSVFSVLKKNWRMIKIIVEWESTMILSPISIQPNPDSVVEAIKRVNCKVFKRLHCTERIISSVSIEENKWPASARLRSLRITGSAKEHVTFGVTRYLMQSATEYSKVRFLLTSAGWLHQYVTIGGFQECSKDLKWRPTHKEPKTTLIFSVIWFATILWKIHRAKVSRRHVIRLTALMFC